MIVGWREKEREISRLFNMLYCFDEGKLLFAVAVCGGR